ncbi:glycosyltransferase family 2 protein [Paenalcaligenes sp. Me131]|uniref:glycosyltransferase family 2 protein n=1 Tax=Paenalcaligenes sp. Me131 TaxID=3392636 RepID=UPI003D2665AF
MAVDIYAHITPVIIVKNGAAHVHRTISALKPFRQVVVYDNGSTDDTISLLGEYPNVKVVQGSFMGFGPTKNAAASHAETDWVLSLDIDEQVNQTLLDALADWPLEEESKVGEVLRNNYFCGKHIRTNGWGKDWLCRLYNRRQHCFTDSQVHEKVKLDGRSQVVRLKGGLEHEAVTDVGQLLVKTQYYSELYANSERARLYAFPVVVFKAAFRFFRSYFLQLGILSGSRGMMIAVGEATGVFFRYSKVYQRKKFIQKIDKNA